MFGLGFQEMAMLGLIFLLLFGPRFFEGLVLKLRDGVYGFQEQFQTARKDAPRLGQPAEPKALTAKE